jgi:SET domain-containing protein
MAVRAWTSRGGVFIDHEADVVSYTALRRIEVGEEITINYSGDPEGRADLWFDEE